MHRQEHKKYESTTVVWPTVGSSSTLRLWHSTAKLVTNPSIASETPQPSQPPSGQRSRCGIGFLRDVLVESGEPSDRRARRGSPRRAWFAMGRFSPTKLHGDCEEIANTSTAYGRRRRNWIDAHGAVPPSQVLDASCGNERLRRAAARLPKRLNRAEAAVVVLFGQSH
jgi:hypothetical protein